MSEAETIQAAEDRYYVNKLQSISHSLSKISNSGHCSCFRYAMINIITSEKVMFASGYFSLQQRFLRYLDKEYSY